MAKFNFEDIKSKLNINKKNARYVKLGAGAVAVVVAVAVALPGALSVANTLNYDVITDEDIAAYNNSKYEEENAGKYANENGNKDNDIFSGFEEVPEATPMPESKNKEKDNLQKKIKDIMKDGDAVAPGKGGNGKSKGSLPKTVNTSKDKSKDEKPETENPAVVAGPNDMLHVHDDGVERKSVYNIKTNLNDCILTVNATPKADFGNHIKSVVISVLYNDEETESRTVSNVQSINESFWIDYSKEGYCEVEFYIIYEYPNPDAEISNEVVVENVVKNETVGEIIDEDNGKKISGEDVITYQQQEAQQPSETEMLTDMYRQISKPIYVAVVYDSQGKPRIDENGCLVMVEINSAPEEETAEATEAPAPSEAPSEEAPDETPLPVSEEDKMLPEQSVTDIPEETPSGE